MSDIISQAHNIKLKYSKTRKLTTDLFIQVIDLILLANGGESKSLTAAEIVKKLEALTGNSRLRASAIQDLDIGTEVLGLTAEQIRDLLQSLIGDARLSAKTLSDLTATQVLFDSPITGLNNVQDIIFYILGELSKYELNLGLPDEDGQALTSNIDGTRSWKTITTDKNWTYVRLESSIIWEFDHPLDKKPSVTLLDENNKIIHASIEYVGNTGIRVLFNTPQIGSAELN